MYIPTMVIPIGGIDLIITIGTGLIMDGAIMGMTHIGLPLIIMATDMLGIMAVLAFTALITALIGITDLIIMVMDITETTIITTVTTEAEILPIILEDVVHPQIMLPAGVPHCTTEVLL